MTDIDRQPLDLSALDPLSDPARWHALVAATAARAEVAAAGRSAPLELIASWSRPLLLAAAALIALLVPVEMALEQRERRQAQVEELVTLSVEWANGAIAPSGSELRRALAREVKP